MKKKLLSLLLASALALGITGGLAACDTEPKEVTGITIDSLVEHGVESIELAPDEHFGLRVSFTPNGSESNVTWTSSDTKIATVNGGYVTAVNTGNATITATTDNGKTATCTVIVGEWTKYCLAGDVNGWADKAEYTFVQDENDLHKLTLTVDLPSGGFKIKIVGSWDNSIGTDSSKTNNSLTATGSTIDIGGDNITVADSGNYTITLQLRAGGGVESLTYVRKGDVTAAE